jgi:hypothetical protein
MGSVEKQAIVSIGILSSWTGLDKAGVCDDEC